MGSSAAIRLELVTSRRGPELPYKVVGHGVTPWGSKWLVAAPKCTPRPSLPRNQRSTPTFIEVLDERPSFSVIVVNAPIGFARQAWMPARGRATGRREPFSVDEVRPFTTRRPGPP
jgi:hypothetical protein